MGNNLSDKIKYLIENNIGDVGRLKSIQNYTVKGKPLYHSDQKYLQRLLSESGIIEKKISTKKLSSESEKETVSELKKELDQTTEKIEKIEGKLEEQEKKSTSIKHYKSEGLTLGLSIGLGLLGIMGIGHIYVGKVKRGIAILIGGLFIWVIVLIPVGILSVLEETQDFSDLEILGPVLGSLVIATIGGLALFIWQILNSRKLCKQYNEYYEEHGGTPW